MRQQIQEYYLFTIANTISASSQPKALTSLSRTKHRRQTAINEIPKKIVVTIKIVLLRPSSGCIVIANYVVDHSQYMILPDTNRKV